MVAQRRNSEQVDLLRPDYFGRNEPNASWVHYPSAIMQLCGLRGYYPMGAQTVVAGTTYAKDVACGYDLAYVNNPTAGYLSTATVTALPPWLYFVAANSKYLTYGADDQQHDILGTEATITADERGLTLCGWFRFTTVPASGFGLISKWYATGDQRAYALFKSSTNQITLSISSLGTLITVVSVTSVGTVTTGEWYFIAGRLDPSNTMDVWIDDAKTTLAAGIPASIFDSDEPLVIARHNRTNYLDGRASNCFICASQLSDSIITALWEQSRVMYGKGG